MPGLLGTYMPKQSVGLLDMEGPLTQLQGTGGIFGNPPDVLNPQGGGFLGQLFNNVNQPLMDLSMGILANSGYSTTPRTLGEIVAGGAQFASQRDQARMRNDLLRQQLQQREGMKRLIETLSKGQQGNQPKLTPEQAAVLQSLPADQQAGAVKDLLFPDKGDVPNIIQEMRAFGYPISEEGLRAFQTAKGGDMAAQANLLGLQVTRDRMDDMRRRREQDEAKQMRLEGAAKTAVQNNFNKLQRQAELSSFLQGKAIERGTGFEELGQTARKGFAALGDKFGFDTEEAKQIVEAQKEFDGNTSQIFDSNFARIEQSGALAGSRVGQLKENFPNAFASPEQQAAALADAIQENLQAADALQFGDFDRGTIQALQEQLRSQRVQVGQPGKKRKFKYNPDTGQLEPSE